ncbi:hypothetical protein D3C81_1347850 [compost metagenome]
MHAQANFGIGAQLGLHLALVDLAVRPVLFTLGNAGANHANQPRRLGDLVAVRLVGSPVGAQGQGHAVAVLPINQHVLVHQQVHQGQGLGEQHDDQHQPEGAGEEALREPQGRFHRQRLHTMRERAGLAGFAKRCTGKNRATPKVCPAGGELLLQTKHHLVALPSGTNT